MARNLDDLIRQWAASGEAPAGPPAPPSDHCLRLDQAEAIARAGEGVADDQTARARHAREGDAGEQAEHVQQCPRCQRLVEAFRAALVEGPPRWQPIVE